MNTANEENWIEFICDLKSYSHNLLTLFSKNFQIKFLRWKLKIPSNKCLLILMFILVVQNVSISGWSEGKNRKKTSSNLTKHLCCFSATTEINYPIYEKKIRYKQTFIWIKKQRTDVRLILRTAINSFHVTRALRATKN